MNPSILILLFIFPLSFASSTPSPTTTTCKSVAGIDPTCKSVAHSNPSIPYLYCVNTLSTNHHAKSEDLQGLASIVTKMAITHAESTEARIDDLMDLEHDHALKSKYDECRDAFSDAGDMLRDAFDSIGAKQCAKAMRLLMGSRGACWKCERVFRDGYKPVLGGDVEYERLAELAAAIVAMIE